MYMEVGSQGVVDLFLRSRQERNGKADESARQKLVMLCDLITNLKDEFDVTDAWFEEAPNHHDVLLYFETDVLEFQHGATDPFFQCTQKTDGLRFMHGKGDTLRVEFTVKGVWA